MKNNRRLGLGLGLGLLYFILNSSTLTRYVTRSRLYLNEKYEEEMSDEQPPIN